MKIDCRHVWITSPPTSRRRGAVLRAEIDRHLEHCEICSAVMDSTRNVVILIADERVFEIPAGYSNAFIADSKQY